MATAAAGDSRTHRVDDAHRHAAAAVHATSAAVTIPRVSVLMPVRNGFPWLPDAVSSILSQTFSRFELIVLEDGSSDESTAYLDSLDDPRIRVVATGGVGITRALDVGIQIARGTYIACYDVRDQSRPDRFAVQAALLDERLDIDVVSTVMGASDDRRAPIDDRGLPRLSGVPRGSVMARASVLRAGGGRRREVVPSGDCDYGTATIRII